MNVSPLEAPRQAAPLLPSLAPVGNALVSPQVIHKAVLDVGEEGTEAAAATGIEMRTSTLQSLTVIFSSPFLFAVIDKDTGTVLFLGKVADPSPA